MKTMQDLLSLVSFIITLIMTISSYAEKEFARKEWSTLLHPDSSVITGTGSWKARSISKNNLGEKIWHESPREMLATEIPFHNEGRLTGLNGVQGIEGKHTNVNDSTGFIQEKKVNLTRMVYDNWVGSNEKEQAYQETNYSQPSWQLPVSKLDTSVGDSENITVFPLSMLHKLWQNKHWRIDVADNNHFQFENETFYEIAQHMQVMEDCGVECLNQNSLNESQKGDLDTAETQGRGGGGGGQPILLIKDKGGDSGGWEMSGGGMHGKDSIGPLIMMLTPLIMMCIMMPMMMSVMGGMMNFMRNMAMMMLQWPPNSGSIQQALVTKHRKSDEDEQMRGNEFLNTFIQELSERLELAISKYGD